MRKVKPEDEAIMVMTPEERRAKIEATHRTVQDMEPELGDFEAHVRRGGGDLRQFMKSAYALVDKMAGTYSEYVPCRKGCAHCCKVSVAVSLLEAVYITKMTGIEPITRSPKMMRKAGTPKGTDYCPFLDRRTATCSIYEYRPLACRMFAAVDDHKGCESHSNAHWLMNSESNPLYTHIIEVMAHATASAANYTPYTPYAEIRAWFGTKTIKVNK